MAETTFNIKTTSDNAGVVDFVNKLNTTDMTVKQLSTSARDLKASLTAGSQAQKDFGDIMAQVNVQTKSAAQQQNSLIGIMKADRQERRLGMFAVMESMHALEGLTGGQNEFSKAVTSGAQTVFGMKFALEAMGMAATSAWPVAIIVAAWSVINGVLSSHKKATEDLNDVLRENLDLEIKLGNIAPEAGVNADVAKLAEAKKKLADMQIEKQMSDKKAAASWGLAALSAGGLYGVSESDIAKQERAIDELQLKISAGNKKIADENGKALDDYKNRMDEQIARENPKEKNSEKAREKEISDENEITDILHQQGTVGDLEYEHALRMRAERATRLGDEKTSLLLWQQIQDLQVKGNLSLGESTYTSPLNPARSKTGTLGTPIGSINSPANLSKPIDFAAMDEKAAAEKKAADEKQLTQQYLLDPLKSGMQSVAYSALQGFNRMWEQSSGFARTVLGQALESIADTLIQRLSEDAITSVIENKATGIIGFLAALAGGGDVSYGGGLKFAANGINLDYANGVQNVVVGERGRELMQVGRNGVRVISNSNLQAMNQASQASRNGGSSEMAMAINNLASKIVPQTATDLYFATKKAAKMRSRLS